MKNKIKYLINIINHLLLFWKKNIKLKDTFLFLFRIQIEKSNMINLNASKVLKTRIFMRGENNLINALGVILDSCQISIEGRNNTILIENNVILRKATINIRGTNNVVEIGKNTTFGTVRMVNVGSGNIIKIGSDCLFSDCVEIWASDTHSIYDSEGRFINPEKPIVIGNNVWIGSNVTVLKGVEIKDGAIIGMNSVITKNVEKSSVCVGNPQRVIKKNISWGLEYENCNFHR